MPFFSVQRRGFSLFRLTIFSVFVLQISSDLQNDRQLQSVESLSKNSAEGEEPLLSTIPNLDRLPDLLIINPTFEPPPSHVPGQSATRRELLLRTLQLRQRPTAEAAKVAKVPKAQPLPKLDGQLLVDRLATKRIKGKKGTTAPLQDKVRNRPPLIRPKSDHSSIRMTAPTTDLSTQKLKQQEQQEHREYASTEETDTRIGNGPSSNNQPQQQQQKATQVAPYDNFEQQRPFVYQQHQLRPLTQFQAQQQQQQQLPYQQHSPPQQQNFAPRAEGSANFNGQPSPVETNNNFVYPQQQQQPSNLFATQHQKPQQIAVPRRLRFYFTPSSTTVNSDFTFAPGSPGLACFYGFPIPQYNTPRKRCIPDHPMCGIQFTCVMDVHAVDEWGREVEQWWTEPNGGWNGAEQQQQMQTNRAAATEWGGTRTGPWGQQQQQVGAGWAAQPM